MNDTKKTEPIDVAALFQEFAEAANLIQRCRQRLDEATAEQQIAKSDYDRAVINAQKLRERMQAAMDLAVPAANSSRARVS